jgi:hypothetical protein
MAVGEQRDQQAIDQGGLTDDAIAQLVAQRVKCCGQPGGRDGFWHVHDDWFGKVNDRTAGGQPARC